MRASFAMRVLAILAMLITLTGCLGLFNWVRVSPDGRYTTAVVGEDELVRLLLIDLETRERTEAYAAQKDMLFYDIQWRPDSQGFCFIATQNAQASEPKNRLMFYDLSERRLVQLPIESPGLARWNRDGSRLLVLTQQDKASLYEIYETKTWTREWFRTNPLELAASDSNLVALLSDERILALGAPLKATHRYPEGDNLYILQQDELQPYTTTGDVVSFWVAPDESRVRWARVRPRKWLAVFESPLQKRQPRRIILIEAPDTEVEGRAMYRFSPDGEKIAWSTEDDTVHILDLSKETVRVFHHQDLHPQKVSSFCGERSISRYPIIGFDWRGNDTLLMQWGDEIEIVSTQSLRR